MNDKMIVVTGDMPLSSKLTEYFNSFKDINVIVASPEELEDVIQKENIIPVEPIIAQFDVDLVRYVNDFLNPPVMDFFYEKPADHISHFIPEGKRKHKSRMKACRRKKR